MVKSMNYNVSQFLKSPNLVSTKQISLKSCHVDIVHIAFACYFSTFFIYTIYSLRPKTSDIYQWLKAPDPKKWTEIGRSINDPG